MRVLIIGPAEKEKLKRLVKHAESHIFGMDQLLDTWNKELEPAGDMKDFVCTIPNGYKIVYSIEDQLKGNIRHLSVSVSDAGKYPSPEAIQLIMDELNYKNKLENCIVWTEKLTEDSEAINIAEIIK